MKVSHKWLQKYFDKELPSAKELADILTFHAFEIEGLEKVDDDWIIDVDVLPNRSSDCLSHRGIAKEISTLISIPLKEDPLRENLPQHEAVDNFFVDVENKKLCPRYMAGIVRGVTIKESPKWLKEALEAIGQKPINNVVDATNYVMFNLGQPLHAFDLDLLEKNDEDKKGIRVRLAKNGEKITTLSDEVCELRDTHQIITDAVSGEPLAVAGVKGGKKAELTEKTTAVVLESANFDFVNVRKMSQELKLPTEASLRFQNEPSPKLVAFAMRDLITLIKDIAGGELVGVADEFNGDDGENLPIEVSLLDINSLLGTQLTDADVENILIRFEWEFSKSGDDLAITPPWERTDMDIKETIIEEIGRVYGYKNIEALLPDVPEEKAKINKRHFYTEKIQNYLFNLGYSEVLTYTLKDKGEVELENPLASDKAFMRTNIKDGILEALELNAQNAPLLGIDAVKIFEIGTVFTKDGERNSLAIGVKAVVGKQTKLENVLREDVKLLLKELDSNAEIKIADGVYEIILDNIIKLLPDPTHYEKPMSWNVDARYSKWSQFPFVLRDIAVWAPKDVPEEDVLKIIQDNGTELLIRTDKFDEFEKDDKISHAWHLVFQSKEKTLTDSEIGEIMKNITDALNAKNSWEVR